jgi:endo-1,4-beta-xylanase
MLDAAVNLGEIRPVAWVSPYGGRGSWFTDSKDGLVPAETVLVKELIPHVEARWPIGGDREARWLSGWDMGGFGALKLAGRHPGLFGAVVTYGGAFRDAVHLQLRHPDAWVIVFSGELNHFMANDPGNLLRQQPEPWRDIPRIRLVVGEHDGLLPDHRRLHDLLGLLDIPHEYEEMADKGHDPRALYKSLALKGFQFLTHERSAPSPARP